jgi:hypothetical protein
LPWLMDSIIQAVHEELLMQGFLWGAL